MKNKHIEFIQEFNKITIKGICDELGINHKNVYSGKSSDFNMQIVYSILIYKIKQLLLNDELFYAKKFYDMHKTEVLEDEKND